MINFAAFYNKRTKGEKRIMAITMFVLCAMLIDRVVVSPLASTLSTLSVSIKDQEASIRKSMNMLLHEETIERESKEYAKYSLEAKNPEEEMVALLQEVESVAQHSGVNLIYVKPGTIKDEKGLKKFYANLECEAPMEQVATFFHDVESSGQLVKIEKYQIQPKSKDSSIARSTVSVYKTVLA